MKKSHFLFFLPLITFGPLTYADSFYAGFQAGADFFAVNKEISSQVFTGATPAIFDGLPVPVLTATNRSAGNGGMGGLFLGYSWQFQDFSLGRGGR